MSRSLGVLLTVALLAGGATAQVGLSRLQAETQAELDAVRERAPDEVGSGAIRQGDAALARADQRSSNGDAAGLERALRIAHAAAVLADRQVAHAEEAQATREATAAEATALRRREVARIALAAARRDRLSARSELAETTAAREPSEETEANP